MPPHTTDETSNRIKANISHLKFKAMLLGHSTKEADKNTPTSILIPLIITRLKDETFPIKGNTEKRTVLTLIQSKVCFVSIFSGGFGSTKVRPVEKIVEKDGSERFVDVPGETYELDDFNRYAEFIDAHSTPTDHKQVKDDGLWKKIYGVESWSFLRRKGRKMVQEEEEGAACRDCGLILPLAHLTIDHQRPQFAGATTTLGEMKSKHAKIEAILKVLRAMDLTGEDPIGPKGQRIKNAFFPQLKTQTATPFGKDKQFDNLKRVPTRAAQIRTETNEEAIPNENTIERYHVTYKGAAFLGLLAYNVPSMNSPSKGSIEQLLDSPSKGSIEQLLEVLGKRCLHHVVNLAPACNVCNSSRGGHLKFFSKSPET